MSYIPDEEKQLLEGLYEHCDDVLSCLKDEEITDDTRAVVLKLIELKVNRLRAYYDAELRRHNEMLEEVRKEKEAQKAIAEQQTSYTNDIEVEEKIKIGGTD